MARYNFNLRNKEAPSTTPIRLIVRYGGNMLTYATQERIKPDHWCNDQENRNYQRAKQSKALPTHSELNARLDHIEQTAKDVFRRFDIDQRRNPSVKELREHLNEALGRNTTERPKDLFSFIEYFIAQSLTRIDPKTGRQISPLTITKYRNSLNHLKGYSVANKKRVDFDTIDMDFYHAYCDYLANERSHSLNTIGKNIRILKTFLHDATEKRINTNLTFKSSKFKAITELTDKIYLTRQELDEIYKLDLSDCLRLERVRDLFIIGANTGFRFSDLTRLTKDKIDKSRIHIKQYKTGKTLVVAVHPIVAEIWNKYSGQLPLDISNQKFNDYIKEVGQMVPSLHKKVHIGRTKGKVNRSKAIPKWELIGSHTARRSFATNLYKEGANPLMIMAATGHTSEKAFMAYIRATPEDNAKLLEAHWAKMGAGLKVVNS